MPGQAWPWDISVLVLKMNQGSCDATPNFIQRIHIHSTAVYSYIPCIIELATGCIDDNRLAG
jgi:hypothetical protein